MTALVTYKQTGAATAAIAVNGLDLTDCASRVSIDHHAGSTPQVFITFSKDTTIDELQLEADVTIVRAEPPLSISDFVGGLEPDVIDLAVLQLMEAGGPETYGAAVVELLKQWAEDL